MCPVSMHPTSLNIHYWTLKHHTAMVGDFNTPLSTTDRASKQKINKETRELSDTVDQMDSTLVY
jgi:hypothetical protein